MKLLIFASVLITALARPQEVMSPDEVELVQPGRSESETAGGRNPGEGPFVFVLRGVPRFPGVGSFFGDVPNIPGFGSSDDRPGVRDSGDSLPPFLGGQGSLDDVLSGVLGGAFGGNNRDDGPPASEDGPSKRCGLVCMMLSGFLGLQDEIDAIQSEIHNDSEKTPFLGGSFPSFFDGDFDINNSTYEEKELEDGTKVRINRTTVADKDGSGNKFFFHSSVHNFGGNGGGGSFPGLADFFPIGGSSSDAGQPDTDSVEDADDQEEEEVAVAGEDEDIEDPVVLDALPDIDPALNEIDNDEEAKSPEFGDSPTIGVDQGLIE